MPALHPQLQRRHHVVAQIVEAELVVRAVGDIALIGGAALGRRRLRIVDATDRETEPREEVAHPLGIAAGQIIVDGDEMGAPARERVEIQRQRRDERLPFPRRHLRDLALMQHDAADELHVVRHHVPLQRVAGDHHFTADQPAGGFAHRRECFGQEIVQRALQLGDERLIGLAQLIAQIRALGGVGAVVFGLLETLDLRQQRAGPLRDALAEARGLCLELFVAEVFETRLVLVNRIHDRLDALQLAIKPRPKDFCEQRVGHDVL